MVLKNLQGLGLVGDGLNYITGCLCQCWFLKKNFLEGSNNLFYPTGYTLFVTLRKLAYFSQLTYYDPKMRSTKVFSVNF